MSTTQAALASSLGASLFSGLMQLCMVPIYVAMMGVEAWGIIGFQLALMGLLQVFDLGIATTLGKSIAAAGRENASARALVSLSEITYLIIGTLLAAALLAGSAWLSESWLSPVTLSHDAVSWAIRAMAGAILGNWMVGLYQAGLMGRERFQASAIIKIAGAIVSNGGSILVLWRTGGSLNAFLAWQAIFSFMLACVYRTALVHDLPCGRGATRWALLGEHWRFASGMGAIGITGVLIANLDKILLSRLLTLEDFAHYSLAMTVVGGLLLIMTPVYNITLPRLSSLVRAGDAEAVATCYFQRAQLMAWLVLPGAAILCVAAHPLIYVWTGQRELASAVAPLVSIAVLGTLANSCMIVPFALQLASGRTGIGLFLTILILVVLVPGLIYSVLRWGAAGGAIMWSVSNALYLLVGLPLTHHLLLRGRMWHWFTGIAPLALSALLPVAVAAILHPDFGASRVAPAIFLAGTGAFALGISAFFARRIFPRGPLAALLNWIAPQPP